MKKRLIATVTVLALLLATLTGCGGNSKDDYRKDVRDMAVEDFIDILKKGSDPDDIMDEVNDILDDFEARTAEGKTVKKNIKKFFDLSEYMFGIDIHDLDEDDLEKVQKATKDFYDSLDDFRDSAEDSGVDEDDLESVDEFMDFLSDGLDVMEDQMSSGSGRSDRDNERNSGETSASSDYIRDFESIAALSADMNSLSIDDPEDAVYELNDIIRDFSAKTPEGKTIKKDVEKMIDILNEMVDNQDDEDTLNDLYDELIDLSDTIMDDFEAFGEAAEDAGVTEDDIADLDY